MKHKNFPAEQSSYGGIPAEEAISQYQSRQIGRLIDEAHLRLCAKTFFRRGGTL